jgi:phosphoribosylamine---glycine ligase
VRICADQAEAEAAIDDALVGGRFGAAGETIVIEEFLDGPELSVFLACGARGHTELGAAQDYKRALDGDRGANTGGMGSYTPAPAWTPDLAKEVDERITRPTLDELARRGLLYCGVLYLGLVLTADGPKVLEFNVRFGDPEAQVILPVFRGVGRVLAACANGEEVGDTVGVTGAACVTVVLASGGYPGDYEVGKPISGLEEAAAVPGAIVFHAGTRREGSEIVTAGGRVLAVSGLGPTVAKARAVAYAAADRIHFEGLHRRADIAAGS